MGDTYKGVSKWASLSFNTLIAKYSALQSTVLSQIQQLASRISVATPGKFLLLQFAMSQVTQIGDSISNLVSQVQSVINATVGNQKTS